MLIWHEHFMELIKLFIDSLEALVVYFHKFYYHNYFKVKTLK